MSRRKNGTNRAAAALGLNPYGWGNGKGRKCPRKPRWTGKAETPADGAAGESKVTNK